MLDFLRLHLCEVAILGHPGLSSVFGLSLVINSVLRHLCVAV